MSSGTAFMLMKSWLNACLSQHTKCCSSDLNLSVFPTRLLSVSDGELKLVQTAKLPQVPVPYFTLSHCWGKIENLKLSQNNVQSLEAGIPENDLCPAFKDAFHVTRTLGYRYIWIDSLCIVQDERCLWWFNPQHRCIRHLQWQRRLLSSP